MSNYRMLRLFASVLLILSVSITAFGDTLRLKDGSRIKGKIVGFAGGKFTVAMGEGSRRREMTFAADDIESIEFDTSQSANTADRDASYAEPAKKPLMSPPAKVITTAPKPTTSSTGSGKMSPISWEVKVLADQTANGWTNSGWVIKKGQRIRISGDGTISLGKGNKAPASGVPELDDNMKLLKNVATGALIAVIGDDNNDFIYVGAEREFTATRDGALFLGINEGYLEDNSGSFSVKIEILTDAAK